jgi:hypothetical protein
MYCNLMQRDQPWLTQLARSQRPRSKYRMKAFSLGSKNQGTIPSLSYTGYQSTKYTFDVAETSDLNLTDERRIERQEFDPSHMRRSLVDFRTWMYRERLNRAASHYALLFP